MAPGWRSLSAQYRLVSYYHLDRRNTGGQRPRQQRKAVAAQKGSSAALSIYAHAVPSITTASLPKGRHFALFLCSLSIADHPGSRHGGDHRAREQLALMLTMRQESQGGQLLCKVLLVTEEQPLFWPTDRRSVRPESCCLVPLVRSVCRLTKVYDGPVSPVSRETLYQ